MCCGIFLWVGVGLGLLLLVVVILCNTPQAGKAIACRAEEYQRQEEERKEKEGAEVAREARQMESFRKQCLVVHIREKDGRQSSFESVLIRMLFKSGVTVKPLLENDGRAVAAGDTASLKDGLLALVGTSWRETVQHEGYSIPSSYESDGGYQPAYTESLTHCDYRLLAVTEEGAGKILGAGSGYQDSSKEDKLANSIIRDLSSALSETSENK